MASFWEHHQWLLLLAGGGVTALLVLRKLQNFSATNNAVLGEASQGEGALRGLSLKPATKGVRASYSPAPRAEWWWLQGQRLDTSALYQHLGEDGIREISAAFYSRVYADTAEGGWFRDMFQRRATLEQSIARQAAFFSQMWGAPSKPYTSSNRPHCLRAIVGDHAGAKMFVMHNNSRAHGEITKESAARWWSHMDAALLQLRPTWRASFGEELGEALEKTVRWFCDHVLERMVWGGPAESPLAPPRIIFGLFKAITAQFVRHSLVVTEPPEPTTNAVAATMLQLPQDVVPYKRLPAEGVFTVDTMPRGLLSRHNTKAGVWGEINCVQGKLQLNQLEGAIEEVVLAPGIGAIGIVAPTQCVPP